MELWALAVEAAPKNLARYQKAVGSSSGFTLRAELFATDGIAGNFPHCRSTSTSGQSLEITYTRPVTIASAHLYTGVISSTPTENWANFKFQSHNGNLPTTRGLPSKPKTARALWRSRASPPRLLCSY